MAKRREQVTNKRARAAGGGDTGEDPERHGFPPVWGLVRGGEYSDRQTARAWWALAGILFVLAVVPGVSTLLHLAFFGGSVFVAVTTAERNSDRAGLAAWWYRPSRFPWLAVVVLGSASTLLAAAASFLGLVLLVPAAIFSVMWMLLVARWAAYRLRIDKTRAFKVQPLTPARLRALDVLDDDPARFMRHQAHGAGHGVYLGSVGDRWVFSEPQHTVMVLGPPRSGKTSAIVIPTILSWCGPLLCTSTKTDVLADTVRTRSSKDLGTCWLFDPTGTVPLPKGAKRMGWSPLSGCENWERARDRARVMVGAATPARGVINESHWTERATALLGPLLHAAALAKEDMAEVVAWINNRDLQIPKDHLGKKDESGKPVGSPQALGSLVGIDQTEEREQSGIWSTTAGVVSAYQSERALATTRVTAPFNADGFVRSEDSIYVAAGSDLQGLVAPLVVAMIDEVRRATYRASGAGTLPLPVLLALDEVRNIAPIPNLPSIISEAGGQGLVVLACFQDLSQAQERWPAAAAGFMSLFNTNVVLRGIKERSTLELVSSLFGEHEVEVRSRNAPDVSLIHTMVAAAAKQPLSVPSIGISLRKERRVPLDEVSRGHPGQAIVLAGAEAPEWVHLTPAFGSFPWQEILEDDVGEELLEDDVGEELLEDDVGEELLPPEWRIHDEGLG